MDRYQLLYEWLKRTDKSKWVETLPLTEPDVPFDEWWEENQEYIEDHKLTEWTLREIDSAEEYSQWHDGTDDLLCITINMYNSKKALIEAFKELLKERHSGRVGRPEPEAWSDFNWCPISGDLTLETLEIMLTVYDLRHKTSMKLWQIGEMLNMAPHQITSPTDTHKEGVDKRKVMNSLASRYLTWADTLIENLQQGRFPMYKKEKGAD